MRLRFSSQDHAKLDLFKVLAVGCLKETSAGFCAARLIYSIRIMDNRPTLLQMLIASVIFSHFSKSCRYFQFSSVLGNPPLVGFSTISRVRSVEILTSAESELLPLSIMVSPARFG